MSSKGYKMNSKVVWPGVNEVTPRHVTKVGRNQHCPCGSEKKYKDCHERAGDAFLEKLALEKDKEHRKEIRRQLKEQGVPWYKRLLLRR